MYQNLSTKNNKKSVKGLKVIIFAILFAVGMNFSLVSMGNSGISIVTKAEEEKTSTAVDAYNQVNKSKGGVIGGVKDKITKISADAQSIILTLVMAILICSTLWTATKFSGAGDNPQQKAALKTALIFQVLGIVFVASYSGAILFGLNNLNIFS